jgi:hypothetical protein
MIEHDLLLNCWLLCDVKLLKSLVKKDCLLFFVCLLRIVLHLRCHQGSTNLRIAWKVRWQFLIPWILLLYCHLDLRVHHRVLLLEVLNE